MLQSLVRHWKLLLLVIGSFLAVLLLWFFLRSWLNGVQISDSKGTLQNSHLFKKAFCSYWQTDFLIPDPQKTPEPIPIWVDSHDEKLISILKQVSSSGEKVEIQYQKDVVHRFWACTPSDYKLLSIKRFQPTIPAPTVSTDKPTLPSKPLVNVEKNTTTISIPDKTPGVQEKPSPAPEKPVIPADKPTPSNPLLQ